jgi:hypothetical protein
VDLLCETGLFVINTHPRPSAALAILIHVGHVREVGRDRRDRRAGTDTFAKGMLGFVLVSTNLRRWLIDGFLLIGRGTG